jgi:hypothetical protein
MVNPERYPYIEARNAQGHTLLRPLLPITLSNGEQSVELLGLLDTGATVNVLPFDIGLELGFSWGEQTRSIELAGNLGQHDARGVILTGRVSRFAPIVLIFAWTRAPNVPLILGQVNFFAEFDICFFWARKAFEISLKSEAD